MKIKIPMRPWKGDWSCPWEEASILCLLDEWHEESPGLSVHRVEFGDVEILCRGISMEVEPMGVFVVFTAHNILEKSWDEFMEEYGADDWMEGSGERHWTSDDDWKTSTQGARWWPGCDLIVPVTELEFVPLPEKELIDS